MAKKKKSKKPKLPKLKEPRRNLDDMLIGIGILPSEKQETAEAEAEFNTVLARHKQRQGMLDVADDLEKKAYQLRKWAQAL